MKTAEGRRARRKFGRREAAGIGQTRCRALLDTCPP